MRRDTTHPRQFAFGPFRLLPTRQLLLEGDSPVRLGARARDLLIALVEQAGEVITKEVLSARLWPNIVVEEATAPESAARWPGGAAVYRQYRRTRLCLCRRGSCNSRA